MAEHWAATSASSDHSSRLLAPSQRVDRMSGSRLELARQQHRLQKVDIPKPENLDGRGVNRGIEAECLRILAMDPHTRGIKRVEIIRMYPKGTGPNWTYGALDPMPTRAGLAIAQTLMAPVYGRWALAD